MLKKLNRATSGVVPKEHVKVLQFGGGNFLHAFADWMIELMNEKTDFNGGITVIEPLRKGKVPRKNDQDNLFHVSINGLQNGKRVSETRLITCINNSIDPYNEFDEFLTAAENPYLEFIFSNTTESGIAFNSNDRDPKVPSDSFPGKLTSFLFHRFNHFKGDPKKGVTLLPCELIEKNAETLKQVIHQYIDLWKLPDDFRKWIDSSNSFFNTLVDRIVPGFPKDIIGEIQEGTGFEDKHVVMAEPFHLWVIQAPSSLEKIFPAQHAGLSVKFVHDLTPYRVSKVRILNGAHTAMVPVAYLAGLRTVRETIDDDTLGKFIREIISEEVIPTLNGSKQELQQFAADVIERFQNPFIRHELSSIALNSISKFRVRVLPTILSYVELKKSLPVRLASSLAALIRFYKGEFRGEKLPVNDSPEVTGFFQEVWKTNDVKLVASAVLSSTMLWGVDLTTITGLQSEVEKVLAEWARVEVGN